MLPGRGEPRRSSRSPSQPPEAQQVDVAQRLRRLEPGRPGGTLTATALTGLDMSAASTSPPLLHGNPMPFGEPTVYPGGISYGAISPRRGTGRSSRTTADATIEVLNILLGEGNDRLTITSTLVPGADHNADGTLGTVAVHGGLTTVHGGGNSLLEVRGHVHRARGSTLTRARRRLVGERRLRRRAADHRSTASLAGTITALNGATLTLSGGTFADRATRTRSSPSATRRRRATRIGGDTIIVTGGAGPDSPLVVYGDTSQDGSWYSGDPRRPVGRRLRHEAVPERDRQRHAELLLPAREPVPLRRQRRDRRERAVRGRRRRRAADRRLHRLRRRRRRPDHRQPGGRLPRRRLGRRRRSAACAAPTRSTATTASTST